MEHLFTFVYLIEQMCLVRSSIHRNNQKIIIQIYIDSGCSDRLFGHPVTTHGWSFNKFHGFTGLLYYLGDLFRIKLCALNGNLFTVKINFVFFNFISLEIVSTSLTLKDRIIHVPLIGLCLPPSSTPCRPSRPWTYTPLIKLNNSQIISELCISGFWGWEVSNLNIAGIHLEANPWAHAPESWVHSEATKPSRGQVKGLTFLRDNFNLMYLTQRVGC